MSAINNDFISNLKNNQLYRDFEGWNWIIKVEKGTRYIFEEARIRKESYSKEVTPYVVRTMKGVFLDSAYKFAKEHLDDGTEYRNPEMILFIQAVLKITMTEEYSFSNLDKLLKANLKKEVADVRSYKNKDENGLSLLALLHNFMEWPHPSFRQMCDLVDMVAYEGLEMVKANQYFNPELDRLINMTITAVGNHNFHIPKEHNLNSVQAWNKSKPELVKKSILKKPSEAGVVN